MVLGETQILGQVRDAYDFSRQLEAAGPLLNPCPSARRRLASR